MFHLVIVLVLFCTLLTANSEDSGINGISSQRNDASTDSSIDEEFENLSDDLKAYRAALSSLISDNRRSMKTTECWKLGGICVKKHLCASGHYYITQVPACRTNLDVCCFTWNKYEVRDMRDKGIRVLAMPWGQTHEFGGEGVVPLEKKPLKKKKKKLKIVMPPDEYSIE